MPSRDGKKLAEWNYDKWSKCLGYCWIYFLLIREIKLIVELPIHVGYTCGSMMLLLFVALLMTVTYPSADAYQWYAQ